MEAILRPAVAADLAFLWECLAIAAHEPSVERAAAIPAVTKYLLEWPREGDFGVIVEVAGAPVGAAWARLFDPAEKPFVYVDERAPEIAVGVLSAHRGKGHGGALVSALADVAATRWAGLCLSVREDNPAARLYERLGYRRIAGSDIPNRAGSVSFGMRIRF